MSQLVEALMSQATPSPDEINATNGKAVYRCRVCRTDTGLQWFNHTSCPVCTKAECIKKLWAEWDAALNRTEDE